MSRIEIYLTIYTISIMQSCRRCVITQTLAIERFQTCFNCLLLKFLHIHRNIASSPFPDYSSLVLVIFLISPDRQNRLSIFLSIDFHSRYMLNETLRIHGAFTYLITICPSRDGPPFTSQRRKCWKS